MTPLRSIGRSKRYTLEIAVCTPDEAIRAVEAGADRLELSSALEVGGLTPSLHLFRNVRRAVTPVPIYVLIRPRSGDFSYTDREFEVMLGDAELFMKEGASGIVFGMVEGTAIERGRCRQLLQLAPGKCVFHRAFDILPEPFAAIDELIDLSFQRVLTSGQALSAVEGASVLATLVQQARGKIEILPAGNIRPENVAELIRQTRCDQVHSSARSPAAATRGSVKALQLLGGGMYRGEWQSTNRDTVADLRQILDRLVGHDADDPNEAS